MVKQSEPMDRSEKEGTKEKSSSILEMQRAKSAQRTTLAIRWLGKDVGRQKEKEYLLPRGR